MRILCLASLCLALTSHGRRLQSAEERNQSTGFDQHLNVPRAHATAGLARLFYSKRHIEALAHLLKFHSLDPEAAWQISAVAARGSNAASMQHKRKSKPIVHRAPSPVLVDPAVSAALNMFQGIRTPAALVAGASVSLGFAVGPPSKKDKPSVRRLKVITAALAFISLTSELLAVTFCTNAIDRLTEDGPIFEDGLAPGAKLTCLQILRRPPYELFWVTSYMHFISGTFCLVGIASVRGWIVSQAMGLGRAHILLSGAVFLRMIGAVKRSIVVRDFGDGHFSFLCLRVVHLVFNRGLTRPEHYGDALSVVLLITAIGFSMGEFWKLMRSKEVIED